MASCDAATANGTTRETCLRSRTVHPCKFVEFRDLAGDLDGQIRRVKTGDALDSGFARRMARQKASLPIPFGLTTPIPVITTRGSIEDSTLQFLEW